MRAFLLLSLVATSGFAQSPRALARRLEARHAEARRAVLQAMASERAAGLLPARRGSVAVIAGTSQGADVRGLAGGLADLLSSDLARVHALHPVERMRAQAIATEATLAGTDEASRPRAFALIGAADIVVVDAVQLGSALRFTARVVNMARTRVDATVTQSGTLNDIFGAQRRLSVAVLHALGVEPTASERRAIVDRPSGNVESFVAWAAAMEAIESGDAPQAERMLRRALDADPGVNAAFDAGVLAAAGLAASLGGVVPMPGLSLVVGEDPSDAGLATEGNESEYGEAWFEGAGDRKLNVYEMSAPFSASLPLWRGRLDLSTLWASNRADTPANDVFHAWGFTDLHLRYTQPVGASGVSLTVGAAMPVRDAHGADDDIRRVPLPPDLLPTAMYRRRSAPSASAGGFFTTTLGAWQWGLAGGGEWSASYDQLSPSLHTVAVAPGMRWRVRADAERALGPGRLSIGSSLMALSPAKRAGVALSGGGRTLARASYSVAFGPLDLEAGTWLLHAAGVSSAGAQVRAASTITAYFANSRAHWKAWTVDTGVEVKRWTAGGRNAADLLVPQVALNHPVGRFVVAEWGADYVGGHFHEAPSTSDIPVRGWLLHAGLRLEP